MKHQGSGLSVRGAKTLFPPTPMGDDYFALVHTFPLFGTCSIVSEVLAGKRPLALSHIKRLADYFHCSADVFIDRDAPVAST